MALPITHIHKEIESSTAAKDRTVSDALELLEKHKETLDHLLTTITAVDRAGILTMTSSSIEAREKIAIIALEQLTSPTITTAIQNVMNIVSVFSQLDEQQVKQGTLALQAGLEEGFTESKNAAPMNLFNVVSMLQDADVRRALTFSFGLLKGMGRTLQTSSSE